MLLHDMLVGVLGLGSALSGRDAVDASKSVLKLRDLNSLVGSSPTDLIRFGGTLKVARGIVEEHRWSDVVEVPTSGLISILDRIKALEKEVQDMIDSKKTDSTTKAIEPSAAGSSPSGSAPAATPSHGAEADDCAPEHLLYQLGGAKLKRRSLSVSDHPLFRRNAKCGLDSISGKKWKEFPSGAGVFKEGDSSPAVAPESGASASPSSTAAPASPASSSAAVAESKTTISVTAAGSDAITSDGGTVNLGGYDMSVTVSPASESTASVESKAIDTDLTTLTTTMTSTIYRTKTIHLSRVSSSAASASVDSAPAHPTKADMPLMFPMSSDSASSSRAEPASNASSEPALEKNMKAPNSASEALPGSGEKEASSHETLTSTTTLIKYVTVPGKFSAASASPSSAGTDLSAIGSSAADSSAASPSGTGSPIASPSSDSSLASDSSAANPASIDTASPKPESITVSSPVSEPESTTTLARMPKFFNLTLGERQSGFKTMPIRRDRASAADLQ